MSHIQKYDTESKTKKAVDDDSDATAATDDTDDVDRCEKKVRVVFRDLECQQPCVELPEQVQEIPTTLDRRTVLHLCP